LALGFIPGLLLGWIAFCVAEMSAAHPEIAKRRGCRKGTCKLTGGPSGVRPVGRQSG
jgi:hypothetical protein